MAVGYVRPARADDATEMARIQVTTWRYAYSRLFPPDILDQLDPDWMSRRWRSAITDPPSPRHRVMVAIEQSTGDTAGGAGDAEQLVGFAAAGPADAEALAPDEEPTRLGADVAAITELLVEPRWGRRGHGSRLLAALVDTWRPDGFRTAVAWAYDRDPATRAFLASAGWEPDGAVRALDVDELLVPQLRMHVSLADQAPPGEPPAA